MARFAGLAAYAIANNLTADQGVGFVVQVGTTQRCVVVEKNGTNPLCRAAGDATCPQIRFACDGDCGLFARRPSKRCRSIDRSKALAGQVAEPSGVTTVRLVSGSVLPSGASRSNLLSLPTVGGIQ